VDTLDVDLIASRLTRTARLRFGHALGATGKPAIRQVLVQAANQVDYVRHETIELWSRGNVAVFESDVTVVRFGSGAVRLPVTHVLQKEGHLISDWYMWTYIDLATECRIAGMFAISQASGRLSA
jgi:hypothetical protein